MSDSYNEFSDLDSDNSKETDNKDIVDDIKQTDDKTDWSITSLTDDQIQTLLEMENEENTTECQTEISESDINNPELHLPSENSGYFSDLPGNSFFRPNSPETLERLKEFDADSVEYIDNVPDFTPFCTVKTENGEINTSVKIGHMTADRLNPSWEFERRPNGTSHDERYDLGNYAQADNELLKKMKSELNCDSLSLKDIEKIKQDNNLVWHECPDGKTMMLVPKEIHESCIHSGGVAEQKYRMQYGNVKLNDE